MQKMFTTILTACCLVIVAVPAQSKKLYKWYDEDNVAHYTAQPPSGKKSEIFHVQVYRTKQPPQQTQGTTTKPVAVAEKKTTQASNQPAAKQLDPEQKKRYCQIARTNLEALETHPRIYITDEKTGEKRYLTPDEHAARMKLSRDEIKKYCED